MKGFFLGDQREESIINKAISVKLENLRKYGIYTHKLWDKLIFNKIKGMFGGKIRAFVSGAAPLDSNV